MPHADEFPHRLGGYHIKNLLLNVEVPLTETASAIARRGFCRIDIYPAETNLDIEFAGELDHSGRKALNRDRRRTNALMHMGFKVIELTSDQVHDFVTFEEIVKRIALNIGKRIDGRNLGASSSRIELRKTLFAWNSSYGRIPK